jgi:CRISPR-associated protein Cas1
MQIVLDTRGLLFSKRNKCFLVETETSQRIIHPSKVSSVVVTMPCRISSPALLLAAENQIPVVFCNPAGMPQARIWSSRFLNISTLRRKQYRYMTTQQGAAVAWRLLHLKIEGQMANMAYIADRKTILQADIQKALNDITRQINAINDVVLQHDGILYKKNMLSVEAFAASRYWTLIGQKLPEPYNFTNRHKRHASDPYNICTNYLYGMLRNQTETAVLSMGLDPALGMLHRDGYQMPSLVFDLMESFRPIIDRLLLQTVLGATMPLAMFDEDKTGNKLSKQGRKTMISLFNNALETPLKYCNRINKLKNHILNEAKLLTEDIKKHE